MATGADYLERIRREFSLAFTTSRLVTEGWDHDIVILDNRLVFRFSRTDRYRNGFRTEIRLLEHLRTRISLPIPDYCYVAGDGSFGGYPLLRGHRLTPELVRDRLTRAGKAKMAEELGVFVRQLHSVPIATAEALDVPRSIPRWTTDYYEILRESCATHIYPRLTRREIGHVERFIPVLAEARSVPYQPTLTHHELEYRHILVNESDDGIAGIIDFSDCAIADPALDFGGIWEYGAEFAERAYATYAERGFDASFLYRAFQHYRRNAVVGLIEAVSQAPYAVQRGYRFEHAYNRFRTAFATELTGR